MPPGDVLRRPRLRSDLLIDVQPEEHAKITADGVIEIIGDQGNRPEAYFLLGGKRRIGAKTGKPLLIILFAAEPIVQCSISAGHPNGQLPAETQMPGQLLAGTVQQPGSPPAPPGRMDAHVEPV